MTSVAVYCSSSLGAAPAYEAVARELGTAIAKANKTLVYGGASVGLMGVVANGALAQGGRVIGVLPQRLRDRELAHLALTELHIVETMHQRKQKMADLADGFVALPGGLGTLEELFEIATWSQIGIHSKPLVLLNVLGFYDLLLDFLDHATQQGILQQKNRALIKVATTSEEALALLG